ncbi:MAG: molybdenum cofactor guanylyltransferase MobA [Alphaproteobacteria bacterium]
MGSRALITGVLLAGGRSRRMGGGDKCLRLLSGRTVLSRVIERVRPQVDALVLNANGDPARFADDGLPVMADVVPGFAGPLAGVLSGMRWAKRERPGCEWLASFATDTPFLPVDLVAKLIEAVAAEGADLACASSAGIVHPVFALWPLRLADELHHALVQDGVRKVDAWTARFKRAVVDWPVEAIDPFFNVNAPEDLESAERLIAAIRC